MGQMKRFGMKLANWIYGERLKDDAIIRLMKFESPDIDVEWLQKQINAVRNNPKEWRQAAFKEA